MPRDPEQNRIESSTRRKLLGVLGGSAAVGLAGCLADDDDDDDAAATDDDDDTGVDDTEDDDDDEMEEEPDSYAQKAQDAWERILANPAPEDQDLRNQAYVEIEEAVRDDMVLLPLQHGVSEYFWYDYVDIPRIGALGNHHLQYTDAEVEDDDEINLINSTFDTLDPAHSTDTASAAVINQMYETLTHYPAGVAEMENKLMTGVEVSEDGLTWTLDLKEGVQFHDGGEMTAQDVKYSWERLALSENSTRANFILGGGGFLGLEFEADEDEGVGPSDAIPDSLGIEVIDDYTIELNIREPAPGVLDILTYTGFAVVPEGLVGDIPGYEGEVEYEEFDQEMANGTGPFEFDEFTLNEEARVTAFDDYHEGEPSIEAVHWEIIEDDEAAYTYAMEQNADVFGVPTQFYDRDARSDLETDDRGRNVGRYDGHENEIETNYLEVPELSTFYFGFNFPSVPRPVRRAVAFVTDHEELIDNVFEGRAVEAFSFSPPPLWPTGQEAYEQWVENWRYEANETRIDLAEEILEENGFTPDDPFEVTLTTYESEVFEEAAELTRDKLAGTGVEMNLEQAPFNTLLERGRDGDLEMYSLGWIWSWEDVAYGHFGFEPRNTNTSQMPGDASGYYLDWQEGLEE